MGDAGKAWFRWAGKAAFAAYLLAVIAFAGTPTAIAQRLAAGAAVIALAHGGRAYGWRAIFLFLAISVAASFATENLSIATGFPFGRYHFEVGAGLPRIGAVPIIVGLLYFTMGYFSWVIAALLLDSADLRLDRRFNVVALPLIAAFVAVQWDVVMDPPNATIYRAWIWHEGGGYFGVPLSNYGGWYLTVWLFFQAFALALHHWPRLMRRRTHAAALPPLLLYLAVALGNAVPYLIGRDGEVADAAGRVWRAQDLRETTVIVMVFTMLFTAVLGLARWFAGTRVAQGDEARRGALAAGNARKMETSAAKPVCDRGANRRDLSSCDRAAAAQLARSRAARCSVRSAPP